MEADDDVRRELIRQILELERTGTSLVEDAIKTSHVALYDAACGQFGAWRIAIAYAGVRLRDRGGRDVSSQAILRRIRRRCASLRSMRAMHVKVKDHRLYRETLDTFGSWKEGVEAAGVNQQNLIFGKNNPALSRDELLEAMRARAAAGGAMTLASLARDNQALARSILHHFKGWRRALAEAGLRAPAAEDDAIVGDDETL
ncbi:MAG: hypothetical protein KDA44_02070 [Planctomycetales bacterium]|nr:hypothetical protein [Planctomycetales bacterium]